MQEKLQQLKSILHEVSDLNYAQQVLGWDQQTYMPAGGADDRGDQLGTLAKIAHETFTSDRVGQLIEDLAPLAGSLPAESDDACLLRVTQRDYQKATRVTSEWVSAYARVTAVAQQHWQNAKAASDFEQFRPDLETILDLRRQYAEFFKPFDHVYDPLLDDFEPGLKTAEVQSIFSTLRPRQIELLRAIKDRPQVENRFLYQPFDAEKQWTFGVEVISKYGYNWERGRQDRSVHPFTTSLGWGDVRITTRVDPNYLGTGMFGTFHEAGHGMYEQGIAPSLRRTALCSGASMAVHESQSRMWENLVGRSLPFWQHFYPRLQELFPTQLGAVSLDQFYRGINKVEPSFIRVEADEATYNLHIMLRLELEIALMEGSLAVKDLPAAWNERMQEYLGVTPPDNANGVLQDVHWSSGLLGYFPTYALGNLISAQLWEKIEADLPQLDEQIRSGQFGGLLGWLREKIHMHGAKFEPQALVQQVTGSKIDPQPYLRYLNQKYGAIYGL